MNWGLFAAFATVIVAAYGAGLATVKLVSERRSKVKVSVSWALMGAGNPIEVLMVTAANTGHRPVSLTHSGFSLPDKKSLVDLDPQNHREHPFPHELTPGSKCDSWMELTRLVRTATEYGYSGKINIVAWVKDAIDNDYKSESFEIDLDRVY